MNSLCRQSDKWYHSEWLEKQAVRLVFSLAAKQLFIFVLVLAWTADGISQSNIIQQKCSPSLWNKSNQNLVSKNREDVLTLHIVVNNLSLFEAWASRNGVSIIDTYAPAGIVTIQDGLQHFWNTTIYNSEVVFADLRRQQAREELPVPGHNLYANNISYVHSRFPDITGEGVVIAIKEFGFDPSDVDFKNRYISNANASPFITSHALLMATLAGGGGVSALAGRGVARGSRLVSSNFAGLLPDSDADYTNLGISVQNHSYGLDIENYYGAGALAYDVSTRNHPHLLHVFSAGNQGLNTPPEGAYALSPGYANLTGNFKMAKNVLLAGSVDSFNQVIAISSRGPTYDGRIKPDLTAYGPDGTSSAAALVSGAAALIKQAFHRRYQYWPSASMTKAVLLCSADDLGAPGPDFAGGYGNLNLKRAVELAEDGFLVYDSLADGEARVFQLQVPGNLANCKVTLCWNDPPAMPNAARALVNNLDLQVKAPDGQVWLPWVLNTHPDTDSLALPASRGRDSLNNTEFVNIPFPEAGVYELQVSGLRIPAGSQAFAIACQWDSLQHFAWTFPLKNDPLIAGSKATLRWENNQQQSTGRLEWQLAGSDHWRLIDAEAALQQDYFKWSLPDTFAAAQLRMTIENRQYLSDTFLISPSLSMHIGFNCPDSLMLHWPSANDEASYQLWGLGDYYLEPLFETTDTLIIVTKNEYPQQRFAVSAISNNARAKGPPSSAPDISTQGVGCYINNLLAFLNDDNTVKISLFIGSVYGVKSIFIEKQHHGAWTPIATFEPQLLQYQHIDLSPNNGINLYRARLDMDNGTEIISQMVTVYFAGATGYLVFPNPAPSGGHISIVSSVTDDIPVFKLYNATGQLLVDMIIEGIRMDIPIYNLPQGYYFWETTSDSSGKRLGSGKLVLY